MLLVLVGSITPKAVGFSEAAVLLNQGVPACTLTGQRFLQGLGALWAGWFAISDQVQGTGAASRPWTECTMQNVHHCLAAQKAEYSQYHKYCLEAFK